MSWFTLISYNIKTTCFILCSFHLCCQNSSDTLRQSHKTSLFVLCCLALGNVQWILWVLWVLGVAFMDWTCSCKCHRCLPDWVLGNLEIRSTPWAHCHIPWVIPVPFCGMAGHTVLLGGPCYLELPLPEGCLSGQSDACQVVSTWMPGPRFNSRDCIVPRWSKFITSPVGGFKVVADWSTSSSCPLPVQEAWRCILSLTFNTCSSFLSFYQLEPQFFIHTSHTVVALHRYCRQPD